MLYISVVFVCFMESTTTTNEGNGVVTVTVNITNPLSTDLVVTVNTMSGTANGEHLFY